MDISILFGRATLLKSWTRLIVLGVGEGGHLFAQNVAMLIRRVASSAILPEKHVPDELFGLVLRFMLVQWIRPKWLRKIDIFL